MWLRLSLGLTWWLLNLFLVRPLFQRLNARALQGWRCPTSCTGQATANTSGLEVLIAGVGRSGTTSMQAALEAMGLRTYKSIDLSFYLPALVRNATGNLELDRLRDLLHSCKVKAIAPEPLYALTPELLRLSPDVKVIFTWRDWQQMHTSSRRALVSPWLLGDVLAPLLCDWMPYGLTWPNTDVGHSFLDTSFSSLLIDHCCRNMLRIRPAYGRFSAHMNSKDLAERKRAVLEYHSFFKRSLNPAALLDFDYRRHGWSDLEAFLGHPAPSGIPFPKLRSKTISRVALKWCMNPWKSAAFCMVGPLSDCWKADEVLVASMVANLLLFCSIAAMLHTNVECVCRTWKKKLL